LKKLDYQKLGLFTIVKQINTVAIQLKLLNSMKIHHVFHVSLLEPYHASNIPWRTHEPPPPIVVNGEQKYEVEEILDLRISHRQLQYLVHWQGYDINEYTWELIETLSNSMEKVENFHVQYRNNLKVILCGIRC
jgi:hypothetical protein